MLMLRLIFSVSAQKSEIIKMSSKTLAKTFNVYLLTPSAPAYRLKKTYIGFSINPFRRRRQHNGEIKGGAWRTRRYRPWEIVCVLSGFEDKISALQFEWLWQHPYKSKKCREMLTKNVKGKKGVGHMDSVKRKLIELHWILLECFSDQKGLVLHYIAKDIFDMQDSSLLQSLPKSIPILLGSENVSQQPDDQCMSDDEDEDNSSCPSKANESDGEEQDIPMDDSDSHIEIISRNYVRVTPRKRTEDVRDDIVILSRNYDRYSTEESELTNDGDTDRDSNDIEVLIDCQMEDSTTAAAHHNLQPTIDLISPSSSEGMSESERMQISTISVIDLSKDDEYEGDNNTSTSHIGQRNLMNDDILYFNFRNVSRKTNRVLI
jgi:predicted GIY-YIG superfamily endonuclease